ncbi:MAG TPA: hypothetical protein VF527_03480 [Pyrinomonadaceae bacterium]|jgi:hypothetical protein
MSQVSSWLPVLSEQWATTYLQILFGLMVFALGIPALAFELIVQEDVRHVVQRRWHLKMWLALVFMLFISSILFVWLLHPLQDGRNSTPHVEEPAASAAQPQVPSGEASPQAKVVADKAGGGTTDSGAVKEEAGAGGQAGTGDTPARDDGKAKVTAPRGMDDWAWKMSVAAAVLLTLVPTLTFVGGWVLFDRCRRVKVIESVATALKHSYESQKSLNENDLEDLIYLGTHGKAGRQKNMVLKVIDETAARVQAGKADYNGSGLEDLILGIAATLGYESQRGNDENFAHAAAILRNIWFQISTNDYTYSSDATATLDTLKELGIFAVRHRSVPTALIYIEDAAACDSDILFEMGVAALQSQNFFVASAVLVKLESLASQILKAHDDSQGDAPQVQARDSLLEVKANLVGLLAHFALGGVSARRRALLSFKANQEYFMPSRAVAFEEAFEYHYNMARFETADKVFALPQLVPGDKDVPDWKEDWAHTPVTPPAPGQVETAVSRETYHR